MHYCHQRCHYRAAQSQDRFLLAEVAHPFEVLDEAGIAAEFASIAGGGTPYDAYDEKDQAQTKFLESKAFRRLNRSRKLSEVDAADYDAIQVKEEFDYARDDVPYGLEDALRAEGAQYSSTENWKPKVVVDGRLMTGQNPASAGPMAKGLLAALTKLA